MMFLGKSTTFISLPSLGNNAIFVGQGPPTGGARRTRRKAASEINDGTGMGDEVLPDTVHEDDDDADEESRPDAHRCPDSQRAWMDELRRQFDRCGRVIYDPPDIIQLLRGTLFDVKLLYRTRAIMWDPPKTWRHLFGEYDYMPCPHCGWKGNIVRNGWHNHGPRRVYHTDRSWWLWGRQYRCRTCQAAGRTHNYKAYNKKSMAHLSNHPSGADLSMVLVSFPVILTRKAAISDSPDGGSLRHQLESVFRSCGGGWAGLEKRLRETYIRRYLEIRRIYVKVVHANIQAKFLRNASDKDFLREAEDPLGMSAKYPKAAYLQKVALALHQKRRNWLIARFMQITGLVLKADHTFKLAKKIRYVFEYNQSLLDRFIINLLMDDRWCPHIWEARKHVSPCFSIQDMYFATQVWEGRSI